MMKEMKNSGIDWIGEVPADWEIMPLKYKCTLNAETLGEDTDPNYEFNYVEIGSVSLEKGIYKYEKTTFGNCPSRARRIVRKNDIIISTVRTYLKAIAVVPDKEDLIVSTGFAVIKPENISPEYLGYMLKTDYFTNSVSAKSVGVSYPAINASDLVSFKILVPPTREQQKIADFLDSKVSEIDKVIAETKSSIENYKEYKQSIITEAVIKGLNKNVQMKDTDSEWIGQIPAHWDYTRIQNLYETVDVRNSDPEALLLSLYTAIGVRPRNELEEKGNKAVTVMNYKIVQKNDVVVNKLLAWMGAIAYSDYDGVTSPDYDVYRAKENANVVRDYYNAYFRHTQFKNDCYKYGHGIMLMRWRTYPEELLRIKVPNPPHEEQIAISEFLNTKCAEIDKLISEKEALVSNLEEYKKSLIYEYVTGKKAVE